MVKNRYYGNEGLVLAWNFQYQFLCVSIYNSDIGKNSILDFEGAIEKPMGWTLVGIF